MEDTWQTPNEPMIEITDHYPSALKTHRQNLPLADFDCQQTVSTLRYQGGFWKNKYTVAVLAAIHASETMVTAMMIAITTPLPPRFCGGGGARTSLGSELSSLIGNLLMDCVGTTSV
jgi:hypothetical protein